jgi:hypothetical protein
LVYTKKKILRGRLLPSAVNDGGLEKKKKKTLCSFPIPSSSQVAPSANTRVCSVVVLSTACHYKERAGVFDWFLLHSGVITGKNYVFLFLLRQGLKDLEDGEPTDSAPSIYQCLPSCPTRTKEC